MSKPVGPRLIEFLALLWKQELDAETPVNELRTDMIERFRDLASLRLNSGPHPTEAAKIREWHDRETPFRFARAWVAERLTCPVADDPLPKPEAEAAVNALLGEDGSECPALLRAVTAKEMGALMISKLMTDDLKAAEVVRELNHLDAAGRTAELISLMHVRYPNEPGRQDWPITSHGEPAGETPASGEGAGEGTDAIAIAGNDAMATVNKMLENKPPWGWKQTKAWLQSRGVKVHTRKSWQANFGTSAPTSRGNVALINETELNRAIREELTIRNEAFDTMDRVAELHGK